MILHSDLLISLQLGQILTKVNIWIFLLKLESFQNIRLVVMRLIL
nr:MAG TPA: hypothetical protein [Podoviridae sp. ctY3D12]